MDKLESKRRRGRRKRKDEEEEEEEEKGNAAPQVVHVVSIKKFVVILYQKGEHEKTNERKPETERVGKKWSPVLLRAKNNP